MKKLQDDIAIVPTRLQKLFEPALLPGEDRSAYFDLVAALYEDLRPRHTLDWLDLKRVADNIWERERSRRLKVAHLSGAAMKMMREKLIFQVVEPGKALNERKVAMLTLAWAKQVPEAVKSLKDVLGYEPDFDWVVTEAMAKHYDDPERFDRMIEATESASGSALQVVQDRRRQLQHDFPGAGPIIEGEVKDADAPSPALSK